MIPGDRPTAYSFKCDVSLITLSVERVRSHEAWYNCSIFRLLLRADTVRCLTFDRIGPGIWARYDAEPVPPDKTHSRYCENLKI